MHTGRLAVWAIVAAMIFVGMQAAHAQGSAPLDNATCLSCHGQPGLATQGADGQTRSLFVSADPFAQSVHGSLPCTSCHTTITKVPHDAAPMTRAELRQQVPQLCGTCHADALKDYANSVHGKLAMGGGNANAAICSDCHTAHAVAHPESAAARIAITKECGTCHADAMKSYEETYHGQILTLGYTNVATCADCHSGHATLPASDPASTVSPAQVLRTCRTCHADATQGFATFQAHATTDDFSRYPYTWIASKLVLMLIVVTFAFFWTHSALWFYREYRDRQQRKMRPHVRVDTLPQKEVRYFERWPVGWRWAHWAFALSVIVLVATGMPMLYPNTAWALVLETAFGGPSVAGIVHRVAAVVMIAVFVGHLVYAIFHIARNWKTFKIFGPDSLMPNLQDGMDLIAMFKWFFGLGPRPECDRWNYQQKFDYWAPFWGVTMLAVTGAMLWFKALTAAYLPGWSFNVATVVHGDECILAAGYLFTIHYFACHWRPDKFPLDIVMFTGSMPLEEFKHEYAIEYARLVKTGQLQSCLVDAPSRPMALGAKIMGFSLVGIGLALLVMLAIGVTENL